MAQDGKHDAGTHHKLSFTRTLAGRLGYRRTPLVPAAASIAWFLANTFPNRRLLTYTEVELLLPTVSKPSSPKLGDMETRGPGCVSSAPNRPTAIGLLGASLL